MGLEAWVAVWVWVWVWVRTLRCAPAPMTIIFLGISFRSSAPVEVVMIFSSTGTPGSEAGTWWG